MSNPTVASSSTRLSSAASARTISRARISPVVFLCASVFALLGSGCGGSPGYGYVGACYGCGYGYGYGGMAAVAGTGTPGNSGNGGPAVKAQLGMPVSVAIDPSGNLFIADSASNTVREVAASTGIIKNALASSLNHPAAVALDPSGNLYVLDQATSTVRRMSPSTGSAAMVAGSAVGNPGYAGDKGPATSAQLNRPSGIAFDQTGNLYIADTDNNRVREVAASTGVITTISGDGNAGYSGDGGPATLAQVSHPAAVAADGKGNVYIADTGNAAIRKVDARTGVITTVAGTGIIGFSGDNAAATSAQLDEPQGVSVDSSGNLFIADTRNQRVREVAARTGIISTIAGDSNQGYSGNGGPSSSAELNNPYAVAIDASGNLYIADSGNGAVRKVLPNPTGNPASKAN